MRSAPPLHRINLVQPAKLSYDFASLPCPPYPTASTRTTAATGTAPYTCGKYCPTLGANS